MAYRIAIVAGSPLSLATPSTQGTFTPLEWSIIRLSKIDALWTIRAESPLQRLLNLFLARSPKPLANERLEALRRMAVLSRHFGFAVQADRVSSFLEAGFTVEQYELLVRSVMPSRETSGLGGEVLI